MKKYIGKIAIYLLNSIAGITFMLSICVVSFESWKGIAMLILSGLWLAGYCIIHDLQIDRKKGGAKRASR